MKYHKCATYGCPNFAEEFEYYCSSCKKQLNEKTQPKTKYSDFVKNGPITVSPWKKEKALTEKVNNLTTVNGKRVFKAGMVIRARTNAEFLNKMLGTSYRQWMKTCYNVPNGIIWMVEFGHKSAQWGNACRPTYKEEWENIIYPTGDKILEYYHGASFLWSGKEVGVMEPHIRVVVEKRGNGVDRVYIIHGVFAPLFEECEFPRKRIYHKVSDVYEF